MVRVTASSGAQSIFAVVEDRDASVWRLDVGADVSRAKLLPWELDNGDNILPSVRMKRRQRQRQREEKA